jgi:hypothetical protein
MENSVLVSIVDKQTGFIVPICADNRDYIEYLALAAANRALLLDVEAPLPEGVTETVENWVY